MHLHLIALLTVFIMAACQAQTPYSSRHFPEMEWRYEDAKDADYLLAPGDTMEVIVHNQPELTRTVTVAPDGTIRIPYSGSIQVSARTLEETRQVLTRALAMELRNPRLDVLLVGTPSQQIFVGGEVRTPGMITLPGLIDPLQAVIMAGGITDAGRAQSVVLMRRMPGGAVKSIVFDLKSGIYDPRFAEWTPLRRFDVVYVTRKPIVDQNLFVQQYVRNALPIDFSLFYDVSGLLNN